MPTGGKPDDELRDTIRAAVQMHRAGLVAGDVSLNDIAGVVKRSRGTCARTTVKRVVLELVAAGILPQAVAARFKRHSRGSAGHRILDDGRQVTDREFDELVRKGEVIDFEVEPPVLAVTQSAPRGPAEPILKFGCTSCGAAVHVKYRRANLGREGNCPVCKTRVRSPGEPM